MIGARQRSKHATRQRPWKTSWAMEQLLQQMGTQKTNEQLDVRPRSNGKPKNVCECEYEDVGEEMSDKMI